MFDKGYSGSGNDFKSNFEARRKKIRFYFKLIASVVVIGVLIQLGALY